MNIIVNIKEKNLLLRIIFLKFKIEHKFLWGTRFLTAAGIITTATMTPKSKMGFIMQIPGPNAVPEEVIFVIQMVLITILAVYLITLDLGIIFIGIQIMAALNILNDCMKLIDEKTKEIPNYLKSIIIRHNDIIKNVNLFNEAIQKMAFVQVTNESDQIAGYLICCIGIGQIFLLCLFGELIKMKTERLSETLYLTNWYELSVKDQKTFLLILAMAQKDFGLKAAGMYDVNLNAFVQIVKLAFSYCTALYALSK
ncbi:odorant receptor 4-like [Phlebotomus argentipes]|uniref:odorant receptor 4-like n=1 Tax=Phlebotomus argentipes TaxID=94469 RepID=UPI0028932EE3|nr:odorant receptor 4-like [Phlebotomus argentipes]